MMLRTLLLAGTILASMASMAAQTAAPAATQPATADNAATVQEPVPAVETKPSLTLDGVQAQRPSGFTMNRTIFTPSVRFSHRMNANTGEADSGLEWDSTGIYGGTLQLDRNSGNNFTFLNYSGVGRAYNSGASSNASLHQLSFSHMIQLERVNFFFGNDFSYMAESNRFTGLEDLGQPVLRDDVLSDDSIIINQAPRFTNSSAAQVEYMIDRRKSLTFGGNYTLLRHRGEAESIDGYQAGGRMGYNYALTRRTTIGVNYRITRFAFNDSVQHINSHTFHMAIGRQLSRNWFLQLAAGPEMNQMGISESLTDTALRFSTNVSLDYVSGTRSFRAAYSEGTRNGSGVMVGSRSRRADVSYGRGLSRNWSFEARAAYAQNSAFSELSTAVEEGRFHSGAAGVRIRRQLGQYLQAFTSYNFQRQGQASGCVGAACDVLTTRHAIEFGVRYSFRPVRVR